MVQNAQRLFSVFRPFFTRNAFLALRKCSECHQTLNQHIGKIAALFSLYVDVLRVLYVAGCAKLILPHSPVPCYPAQASKVAGHFWSRMAQMAWKLGSSCVFVKFKFCQILGPEKPVFGPKIGKIPNPACVSKEAAVKLSRYKLSVKVCLLGSLVHVGSMSG